MTKKLQSITNKLAPVLLVALLLIVWQSVCSAELVPKFMLPSPVDVVTAFIKDFPNLMAQAGTTLTEAIVGLSTGVLLAFCMAFLMDRFNLLHKSIYPLLILSQTIPTVAIAPLLVLWLGYDMAPKIVLIIIVCFFPITVGLLDGFRSADRDTVSLMRAMGASKWQIFRFVKFPASLGQFFAGLRISVSYSVVGAVISEWLGGYGGLGVYMTRVRKSFAFDKMFAVILLISIISLLLMKGVSLLQKAVMPWTRHTLARTMESANQNKGL